MLNRFTEAQQRMLEMASYLEDLPEERFDMTGWLMQPRGGRDFPHHHVYVPRDFDEIGLQCGTTACLAGHVVLHYSAEARRVMADDGPMSLHTFRGMAARLLDLDREQADRLFVPNLASGIGVREYTTLQVARVVRHLALTGKIDWRRAGRAKR